MLLSHLFWGYKDGLCVTSPPHPLVVAISVINYANEVPIDIKKRHSQKEKTVRMQGGERCSYPAPHGFRML